MSNNKMNRELDRQREAEEARVARIEQGTQQINDIFAKAFTPTHFDGVSTAFMNYYMPKLNDQFQRANEQTFFKLARQSILNSTAGADAFGDVAKVNAEERARLGDQAANERQTAIGRVEDARSSLLANLHATADPEAAAQGALGQSQSLQATPNYAPMTDVFAQVLNQGANVIQAGREGYTGGGASIFNRSGSGSSRVVRS